MARKLKRLASLLLVGGAVLAGCRKPPSGPTTLPSDIAVDRPIPPAMPPTQPVARVPAKPPVWADVFVRSPDEPQDTWLVIQKLVENKESGHAAGSFEYRNKIVIDTRNVKQLLLDMRKLAIDPNRRIVLVLDGKGIELSHGLGPMVRFQRSRAGIWSVVRDK